jgi:hypothetical protein
MKKLIWTLVALLIGVAALAAYIHQPDSADNILQVCEYRVASFEAHADKVYSRDETALMIEGCVSREHAKVGADAPPDCSNVSDALKAECKAAKAGGQ